MIKLEYIWIDGGEPTNKLRSKTKVLANDEWNNSISSCPVWGFDGSSTNQAPGMTSDCVLQPVRLYENPLEDDCHLVLCEVQDINRNAHSTNNRAKLQKVWDYVGKESEAWFGFEQEYTLFKKNKENFQLLPLGWPKNGAPPPPQGDYYCGRNVGEDIARDHMDACIKANIKISGINSEVMLGQWEYQIGPDDPFRTSDDLWVARWLLEKMSSEVDDVVVSLDPKPVEGDWNGAGCHTNFSTKAMREEGGDQHIHKAIQRLQSKHQEHIAVYGAGNERRLTGAHETCNINDFRWGVSDRGASIRVPWQVSDEGCGYLEDRRPSANCDPYLVSAKLIETICGE